MKIFSKWLILSGLVLCLTGVISPMTYTTPKLPEQGALDLGIGGSVAINGDYQVLVMGEYSLSSSISPVLRVGYQHTEQSGKGFYAGLEGKIIIAERFGGTDYFSLLLGAHYCEKAGLDTGLVIGNFFQNFDNYVGLDFDINFFDEITYPGHFILGVKIKPFSGQQGLVIELGLPVTSFTTYTFDLAMRFDI
ncbi:MAG: hypothetical protein JW827_11835 [Spirochaetes bacterium]|nr:hypothetical protein [Spirochaetota bacterium]